MQGLKFIVNKYSIQWQMSFTYITTCRNRLVEIVLAKQSKIDVTCLLII